MSEVSGMDEERQLRERAGRQALRRMLLAVVAVLMIGPKALPQVFPDPRLPLTFAIGSLLGLFVGRKVRFVDAARRAIVDILPVVGILMGVGLLILFRHRTGLGGVNLIALYIQERFGWRAGYVQLGIDAVIMVCALFVLPPGKVALSLLGAAIMNMILAMNHRPGRYMAISL